MTKAIKAAGVGAGVWMCIFDNLAETYDVGMQILSSSYHIGDPCVQIKVESGAELLVDVTLCLWARFKGLTCRAQRGC